MPEPHSTTAAGIIAGAGIGLTGTVFGAHVDALLIGLVSSIFISIWLKEINDRLRAAAAVGMSTLLAGYGSPVAAIWLSTQQHGFADDSPLRLLLALVIGAISPTLVPVAITRLKALAGGNAS